MPGQERQRPGRSRRARTAAAPARAGLPQHGTLIASRPDPGVRRRHL